MMNLNLFAKYCFIGVINFIISTAVLAETQPKFTIIPTTPTKIVLPANSTATIIYRVTNMTKITRQLTAGPIPGVTQVTSGAGVCGNPFTLAHGKSCLLTLFVDGSQLPGPITRGPVVCKTNGPNNNTPDPFLCSQPSVQDLLHITGTVETFTIGGTVSGLTSSGLVIQNNGGDNLTIPANATSFQFSAPVYYGGSYNVTFVTQPTGLICTISNGSGSHVTANVTNISIQCASLVYISNLDSNSIVSCAATSAGILSNCQDSGANFNSPTGIVFNPTRTIAFITSKANNAVFQCTVGAGGTLVNCADTNVGVNVLNQPYGIVLNSAGTIAFIVNYGNNTITQCTVSGNTLSACGTTGASLLNSPKYAVLHPAGNFIFISNEVGGNVVQCSVNNNVLSACGVTGAAVNEPEGLAMNAAGTNILIADNLQSAVVGCPVNGNVVGPGPSCVSSGVGSLGESAEGILINAADSTVLISVFAAADVCAYDGASTASGCQDSGATMLGEGAGIAGFF